MHSGGDRGRRPGVLGVVGSSAAATLAVIALVGALLVMFGQRAERMDRVVAQNAATTASPQPVTQAPIAVAPAPRPATPPASAVGAPVVPRAPVALPSAPPAQRAPVVLFDESRRHSLVLQFRNALRAAGWDVDGIGPWVGKIPMTTVYYPPGMEASARALMAAFPTITRSLPAFPGVPTDELTVIICSDFRLN